MFLLIRVFLLVLSLMMLFTFQYVSINTERRRKETMRKSSLHSNMFLLISSAGCFLKNASKTFTFQYVSINIRLDYYFPILANIFTFQYVSINIQITGSKRQKSVTLHSNMFLLILIQIQVVIFIDPSFTFQYVSINILL